MVLDRMQTVILNDYKTIPLDEGELVLTPDSRNLPPKVTFAQVNIKAAVQNIKTAHAPSTTQLDDNENHDFD